MLPRGWLHFLVVLLRSSMAGIPLAMASLMTVADRGLHTMARGIPLRTSTMGFDVYLIFGYLMGLTTQGSDCPMGHTVPHHCLVPRRRRCTSRLVRTRSQL